MGVRGHRDSGAVSGSQAHGRADSFIAGVRQTFIPPSQDPGTVSSGTLCCLSFIGPCHLMLWCYSLWALQQAPDWLKGKLPTHMLNWPPGGFLLGSCSRFELAVGLFLHIYPLSLFYFGSSVGFGVLLLWPYCPCLGEYPATGLCLS